ncbi:MAG: DNA topoisomerase VI subunit B [Planctomycetes bacterium]|nr:DNA topoisomerase VI subunit B [Planctomycetota bacterium]
MPSSATSSMSNASKPRGRDADAMAQQQREISVSEFFAKNRHLLGFDNPRKALMTTIKEAVDNALDACEEAGILPDIFVGIEQLGETRFRVTVRDNGPGIVRKQVENVFGRLLYGSKFHRLKMSRGQQGIGIAAAGMYALMTTGKPMVIHTKPHKNKPSHKLTLAIDTKKNKADVGDEEERHDFPTPTGTEVALELEARYQRGKQSVDEYLKQTAIANPHAQIIYQPPDACVTKTDESGAPTTLMPTRAEDYSTAEEMAKRIGETESTPGGTVVFPRAVKELPEEPKEIKPHPYGIEMGTLLKMLKDSTHKHLGGFLTNEFSRVSSKVSQELCDKSGMTTRTWTNAVTHTDAEKLFKAIQDTKLMSPPTDCLSPIGAKHLLAGLLKGEKAEFYTATTRPPAVYRGNPFQIEVGVAFGGSLSADDPARIIRFANRVPLLYQQSACAAFKAVGDTTWRNYGMSQPKGSLPVGPLVVMIHMASVWVPFTSESKEAIADYDEIRKEMKLALSECGRKLKTYLSRRARMRREGERRDVFFRYISEVVRSLNVINAKLDPVKLKSQFEAVAKRATMQADMEFDADGNPIKRKSGRDELAADETTVIIEDRSTLSSEIDDLASDGESAPAPKKSKRDADDDYDQEGLFD